MEVERGKNGKLTSTGGRCRGTEMPTNIRLGNVSTDVGIMPIFKYMSCDAY